MGGREAGRAGARRFGPTGSGPESGMGLQQTEDGTQRGSCTEFRRVGRW